MAQVRVPIDLNDVDGDGLTIVLLDRINETLHEGQSVIAFEAEDGVQAPATVVRLHPDFNAALVRVAWAEMTSYAPAKLESIVDARPEHRRLGNVMGRSVRVRSRGVYTPVIPQGFAGLGRAAVA